MAETSESNAVRVVKVVVLCAVCPKLTGEHHLEDYRATGTWGDEVTSIGFGVLTKGSVQITVEDARDTGVGPQEN